MKVEQHRHHITVELDKQDDRCFSVEVTDGDGRRYDVMLEFLAHSFGDYSDEVQVNVYKAGPGNTLHIRNRIAVGNVPLTDRVNGAWFSFHEVGTPGEPGYMPRVIGETRHELHSDAATHPVDDPEGHA